MDYWSNLWQEMMARPDGPMAFRIYLQPTMATIYAIIGGIADARGGRPPYVWSVFTDPSHRAALMRDGWKSVRNVFFLAIGMDLVYELVVLGGFRPVQAVIVAVGLAIVPYVLIRGPVTRLARLFGVGASAGASPRRI
jgi:hypothetical protein